MIILCLLERPWDADGFDDITPQFVGPFENSEALETWVESNGGWLNLFPYFDSPGYLDVRTLEFPESFDDSPESFIEERIESVCDSRDGDCFCGQHCICDAYIDTGGEFPSLESHTTECKDRPILGTLVHPALIAQSPVSLEDGTTL